MRTRIVKEKDCSLYDMAQTRLVPNPDHIKAAGYHCPDCGKRIGSLPYGVAMNCPGCGIHILSGIYHYRDGTSAGDGFLVLMDPAVKPETVSFPAGKYVQWNWNGGARNICLTCPRCDAMGKKVESCRYCPPHGPIKESFVCPQCGLGITAIGQDTNLTMFITGIPEEEA